jgi:hypothetical protein
VIEEGRDDRGRDREKRNRKEKRKWISERVVMKAEKDQVAWREDYRTLL